MSRQGKALNQSGSGHFAAIDIGSHTTRMIVARIDGGELVPVCNERRVTRLARNFRNGELAPPAVDRTLEALSDYRSLLDRHKVGRIACGATGVARRALNSADLIPKIAGETGISISVLSEQEEAFFSAKGMLSVLPEKEGDFLFFDVGGGSTEFLLACLEEDGPVWSASIPVGAAVLTEMFLSDDPPGIEAVGKASFAVREKVKAAREQMPTKLAACGKASFQSLKLVGTAGTVTTLAAMFLQMDEYTPYRVNGQVLSREWLSGTVAGLAQMPLFSRRLIPGLEPGREDIILGGAVIVDEIIACYEQSSFIVTDAGLLEGLLLDIVEKERGLARGLRTGLTWRLKKE